jgi:hypothetical protein
VSGSFGCDMNVARPGLRAGVNTFFHPLHRAAGFFAPRRLINDNNAVLIIIIEDFKALFCFSKFPWTL